MYQDNGCRYSGLLEEGLTLKIDLYVICITVSCKILVYWVTAGFFLVAESQNRFGCRHFRQPARESYSTFSTRLPSDITKNMRSRARGRYVMDVISCSELLGKRKKHAVYVRASGERRILLSHVHHNISVGKYIRVYLLHILSWGLVMLCMCPLGTMYMISHLFDVWEQLNNRYLCDSRDINCGYDRRLFFF